jgi:hypothetical protein
MSIKDFLADGWRQRSITQQQKLVLEQSLSIWSAGDQELASVAAADQNGQCRHHIARPCDCARYFPQPGTAQYGC